MGDLIPFRKRHKTWTRAEDYGRVLPTGVWRGEPLRRTSRLARFWRGARWWLALVALALAWVLYRDATVFAPPTFLKASQSRSPAGSSAAPPGTARCA